MGNKTLNMLFGLGLAGLVQLLDPAPVQAQDPTCASQTTATQRAAIPGAIAHTRYSGLFYISRTEGEDICFRQRGERSGGVETHAGNTPSRFEEDSTFIHFYKEFTTVGFLTGDAQVDERIQDGLARLHTQVWNDMYAGGTQLAREEDWEFIWQDSELMGIQVRQERLGPLREGARRYALTLAQNDLRRFAILRGRIFTRGRHSYWTNGPLDVCIEQAYVIPDSVERGPEPACGGTTHEERTPESPQGPRIDCDSGMEELLRGQDELRGELRHHDRRILSRILARERDARERSQHQDHVSVMGGFAHQWITLDETNNGGNYSYRADGNGGRARIHFTGADIIFSLNGGAYTGPATIDGIAHGIPFHGDADGLDVVGHANLVYLPWRVARDLRVGIGGELALDVRDLHDIVYQIDADEVRDQNITEISGALAPGVMLAYYGDVASAEAFLGLGPAFEHRMDSGETTGNGQFIARILTSFQAGDHFLPYLQGEGAIGFREGQLRFHAGAEAGILVRFGDVVIGPGGSIMYSHVDGHGVSRDMTDYQVYMFTGFRTGGQGRSGDDE